MKCSQVGWLLVILSLFSPAYSTCVFESEFGFVLDCAFKKSSLFRVRNLGGLKAHIGLGFSFGDELGFNESLGNLEGNRRRSLNGRSANNFVGMLPAAPANQSPAVTPRPMQYSRPHALTVRPPPRAMVVENNIAPVNNKLVPAFRPIPMKSPAPPPPPQMQMSATRPTPLADDNMKYVTNVMNRRLVFADNLVPTQVNAMAYDIPSFQTIPSPNARVGQSNAGPYHPSPNSIQSTTDFKDAAKYAPYAPKPQSQALYDPFLPEPTRRPLVDLRGHSVEELAKVANVSVDTIKAAIRRREQYLLQQQLKDSQIKMLENYNFDTNGLDPLPQTQTQKPLRRPTTKATTTTTTTTSTTPRPKTNMHAGHKVMNAPKEYYPVGYDKNFDDNFTTKVDLPQTTFHCGDQKHFPGLYGDEDLGCMVFHVCALTDDGLIMKSFLCPESTLFDQTILKCNWWFYVECKNSKQLYDSNIPVSKSYQLMKALTFFSSNYKGKPDSGVDVVALKHTMDQQERHQQLAQLPIPQDLKPEPSAQQQQSFYQQIPKSALGPAVERVSIVMANTTVPSPDASTTAGPVVIVSSSHVGRS